MFDITSDIIDNYNFNLKNYQKSYQSRHWMYNNKKKKILFYKKNIKNFRSNGLSKEWMTFLFKNFQSLILYENCK